MKLLTISAPVLTAFEKHTGMIRLINLHLVVSIRIFFAKGPADYCAVCECMGVGRLAKV